MDHIIVYTGEYTVTLDLGGYIDDYADLTSEEAMREEALGRAIEELTEMVLKRPSALRDAINIQLHNVQKVRIDA